MTPRHFAWQAWHLAICALVSRGRRDIWRHRPWFYVAGVPLGDIHRHVSEIFLSLMVLCHRSDQSKLSWDQELFSGSLCYDVVKRRWFWADAIFCKSRQHISLAQRPATELRGSSCGSCRHICMPKQILRIASLSSTAEPAQCLKCHACACHAKRRWMSPNATPATRNQGKCRQVPRLLRKVPRRHRRLIQSKRATRASPVP